MIPLCGTLVKQVFTPAFTKECNPVLKLSRADLINLILIFVVQGPIYKRDCLGIKYLGILHLDVSEFSSSPTDQKHSFLFFSPQMLLMI